MGSPLSWGPIGKLRQRHTGAPMPGSRNRGYSSAVRSSPVRSSVGCLCVLFALTQLSACQELEILSSYLNMKSEPPGNPMPHTIKKSGVELTATLRRVNDATLEVKFELVNRRSIGIYLTDLALATLQDQMSSRHDATPLFWIDGDTLVFSSIVMVPPPGVSWAVPPTFYASPVAPGGRSGRSYLIREPVQAQLGGPSWQPLSPETSPERTFSAVRFELGVVSSAPDIQPTPAKIDGISVAFFPAYALRNQEVIAVELSHPVRTVVHSP